MMLRTCPVADCGFINGNYERATALIGALNFACENDADWSRAVAPRGSKWISAPRMVGSRTMCDFLGSTVNNKARGNQGACGRTN